MPLGAGTSSAAQDGLARSSTRAIPGRSVWPASAKSVRATAALTGSTQAAARPSTTTSEPNSGTTSGFASRLIGETCWKWSAVSGAVPASADTLTTRVARSRARQDAAGPDAQRRTPRASASTDANESWKPISRGAPGCASATAAAASASVRSTSMRRPRSTASTPMPVMITERSVATSNPASAP